MEAKRLSPFAVHYFFLLFDDALHARIPVLLNSRGGGWGSDAESTIQQQTTDASNSETNEQNGSNETVASLPQVFVTDVRATAETFPISPGRRNIPTLAGPHRKRHPDRLCILHDSLRKSESKGRKPDVRLLR